MEIVENRPGAVMSPGMKRRWQGIRWALGRLDRFDHDVYCEVLELLRRLDYLEADNQELRNELAGQAPIPKKEIEAAYFIDDHDEAA